MRHLFLSASLAFLLVIVTGCAAHPLTTPQAYARTRLLPQPGGETLVLGPEISFTVRGADGVTGYQALVGHHGVTYLQKTILRRSGPAHEVVVDAAALFAYRQHGSVLGVENSPVTVQFPPAYFEGFLRKVDEVAASRAH